MLEGTPDLILPNGDVDAAGIYVYKSSITLSCIL